MIRTAASEPFPSCFYLVADARPGRSVALTSDHQTKKSAGAAPPRDVTQTYIANLGLSCFPRRSRSVALTSDRQSQHCGASRNYSGALRLP
jgi:hypothetical protein